MTTMNPTPTSAETPLTDANEFTVVAYPHPTEPFQVSLEREKGRGLCDAGFARELEVKLATAQARIAELEKMRKHAAEDWADDDTRVKEFAAKHGIQTDDEYGFLTVVDMAERMSEQITALREKLAEEQAGAASMREALEEIHKMSRTQGYDSGHTGIETACEKALRTTTGKATLEELERLRRERDDAVNRADEDRMRNLGFVNKLSELSSGKQSAEKEVERLRAEVERLQRKWESKDPGTPGAIFEGLAKAVTEATNSSGSSLPPSDHVRKLGEDRDSALATIAELRERVKTLEKAFDFPEITKGNAKAISFHVSKGEPFGGLNPDALVAWLDAVADGLDRFNTALQPTAPTEPEKAGSAEPQPATVPLELAEGLADALEWAMDKEPPPCRCIDFSTPPHVCEGHRALTAYRANHPKPVTGDNLNQTKV